MVSQTYLLFRETGKCQNWNVSESIFLPNWKVSESQSVRIAKSQNRKVSGLESVRIGKCRKLLRLEIARNCSGLKVSEIAQIGKCQKLLRLESVRYCPNWKVSETAQIGKGQKFLKLESVRSCSTVNSTSISTGIQLGSRE